MNRKNFLKAALISFLISIFTFVANYFFFHYVTDEGITTVWHPEAGKPFVADLIGTFGVLFLWTSIVCLIIALVFCKKTVLEKADK